MQEIELTCEITAEVHTRLLEKLAKRDPQRIVVNEDCYYDTAMATLFRQAVFVRVRTTGSVRHLQFKFDEPGSDKRHIACIERDFPLPRKGGRTLPDAVHTLFRHFLPQWKPESTWEEVCRENALQALVFIHNTRRLYQLGSLTICVDQVKELGTFVEAEYLCEEGDETQQARACVQQFIADIGGIPLSAGYVELSLRLHKPHLYQEGIYHV